MEIPPEAGPIVIGMIVVFFLGAAVFVGGLIAVIVLAARSTLRKQAVLQRGFRVPASRVVRTPSGAWGERGTVVVVREGLLFQRGGKINAYWFNINNLEFLRSEAAVELTGADLPDLGYEEPAIVRVSSKVARGVPGTLFVTGRHDAAKLCDCLVRAGSTR